LEEFLEDALEARHVMLEVSIPHRRGVEGRDVPDFVRQIVQSGHCCVVNQNRHDRNFARERRRYLHSHGVVRCEETVLTSAIGSEPLVSNHEQHGLTLADRGFDVGLEIDSDRNGIEVQKDGIVAEPGLDAGLKDSGEVPTVLAAV
jgi:hypothetical protein